MVGPNHYTLIILQGPSERKVVEDALGMVGNFNEVFERSFKGYTIHYHFTKSAEFTRMRTLAKAFGFKVDTIVCLS